MPVEGQTLENTNPELVEHTPDEWCAIYGVEILDPDGWRSPTQKDYNEPISLEEFRSRVAPSTIAAPYIALEKLFGLDPATSFPS